MENTMRKKILLLWYTEEDNFGDVLIYQTVKEKLEASGFMVNYHEVGDKSINIIQEANRNDFLIFAGGGIIERYVPDIIKKFKKNKEKLFIPYGVIGLSIGEFDYEPYKENLECWVENAVFFYSRDSYTANYLNNIAKMQKVICSGDVVLGNQRFYLLKDTTGSRKGINIRDIPYPDIMGEFNWEKLRKIINSINCKIVIPDSHNEILKAKIKFENQKELLEYLKLNRDKKIDLIIEQIQKCDFIIGMRYHVILIAALLGVIPLPIMYCPKVERLAEQLEIKDISSSLFDYESIMKNYEWAERHKDKIRKKMYERIEYMRTEVDQMFEKIICDITQN